MFWCFDMDQVLASDEFVACPDPIPDGDPCHYNIQLKKALNIGVKRFKKKAKLIFQGYSDNLDNFFYCDDKGSIQELSEDIIEKYKANKD